MSVFADSVSEGVANPPTMIDFLREAPRRNGHVHRTLAPTEGSRWQNCGASFCAWISAPSEADEILRSRASGCVGSEFRVGAPSGSHGLVLSLRVWQHPSQGEARATLRSYRKFIGNSSEGYRKLGKLAMYADCGCDPVSRLRTRRCSGRRTRPGRRVREGGLCDVPAANSFAPAGGRYVTGSESEGSSFAPAGGRHVTGSDSRGHYGRTGRTGARAAHPASGAAWMAVRAAGNRSLSRIPAPA
jgi:hypothetical protein